MMHPAFFIMIIIVSMLSFGAVVIDHRSSQDQPKPHTQCFTQTIPNISMYHRVSCKGTITRFRRI